MKKFLLGLPIVLIGLFILITPMVLWGEVGELIVMTPIAILSICVMAWIVGDIIKDELK